MMKILNDPKLKTLISIVKENLKIHFHTQSYTQNWL